MTKEIKGFSKAFSPNAYVTDEWEIIKNMTNGSAKLIDAFAVDRKGEQQRYKPYMNLPNRTLLCVISLNLVDLLYLVPYN